MKTRKDGFWACKSVVEVGYSLDVARSILETTTWKTAGSPGFLDALISFWCCSSAVFWSSRDNRFRPRKVTLVASHASPIPVPARDEIERRLGWTIEDWRRVAGICRYEGPWETLGQIADSMGVEWGGRWRHPDIPHFQYTGGITLAQARAQGYNPANIT